MAYLVKLGDRDTRSLAGTKRAALKAATRERTAPRQPLLVALALAVIIILCVGTVWVSVRSVSSAVVAREDPHSAQELADDELGLRAGSANGEVADETASAARR